MLEHLGDRRSGGQTLRDLHRHEGHDLEDRQPDDH